MSSPLQIYDPRERLLVGLADRALNVLKIVGWPRSQPNGSASNARRILLLRLERIGDLLMTASAIAHVRQLAPRAEIDLVVGSWNRSIAELLPSVTRIETLDAPWLTREGDGLSRFELMRRARAWRSREYDLAISFQGDIRNNLLLALSGAALRVGHGMAGGGSLLTHEVPHDPGMHTALNAARLVERAFDVSVTLEPFRLNVPAAMRARASARFAETRRPLIGIHPSGGRNIKQWHPDRFAALADRLTAEHRATIVLTGAQSDRALVDNVRSRLSASTPAIDLAGTADIIELAAILEQIDLLITGDTGPMHLAGAVGTPIVAVFGPSHPVRYAPLGSPTQIVRVDLPCSPCNRIRLPPVRCRGHVPDCLHEIDVASVYRAAVGQLSLVTSP